MTRINCIPVQELTDQHLFAEYREITRVSSLARGMLDYGEYTLGEGHVTFFYDKGLWLANRCKELYAELLVRGYNTKEKIYTPHPRALNEDWIPTKQDMTVNLIRLSGKLAERPKFYTLNKSKVSADFYISKLHNI